MKKLGPIQSVAMNFHFPWLLLILQNILPLALKVAEMAKFHQIWSHCTKLGIRFNRRHLIKKTADWFELHHLSTYNEMWR